MKANSDILVICTYRRMEDLLKCLDSVYAAEFIPNRVMVVDGDQGKGVSAVLHERFPKVEYLQCDTGLTLQRNYALDCIQNEDLVYFIDDDTILGKNYFQAVRNVFLQFDVIGVGASQLPHKKLKIRTLDRVLGIVSNQEGCVTKSGLNMGRYSGEGYCNWLPGCAMTYKAQQIASLRFDVRRKGYALGEDVDFSLRASLIGRLYWSSVPIITHNQSPTNRMAKEKLIRGNIRHKWTLYRDGFSNIRFLPLAWSFLGELIFWVILLFRSRKLIYLSYFRATCLGVFDIFQKGPLNDRG